jgi:primosomal protein N'
MDQQLALEQEQIARAVELGLGVSSPDEIQIITGDEKSEEYAQVIRRILELG